MFEECLLQLKIAYFVTLHDKYAMQYYNLAKIFVGTLYPRKLNS